MLRHSVVNTLGNSGSVGLHVLAEYRQRHGLTLWSAKEVQAVGEVVTFLLRECDMEQVGHWLALMADHSGGA